MSQLSTAQSSLNIPADRARRWWLASAGVLCVGVGGVGVVVPGLPTTIFLIMASWCFTRSCPWLEQRLIHQPIFRPFIRHLEPGAVMPLRARITSTVIMWGAISISSALMGEVWFAGLMLVAGAIGTWCIWRFRRTASGRGPADLPVRERSA